MPFLSLYTVAYAGRHRSDLAKTITEESPSRQILRYSVAGTRAEWVTRAVIVPAADPTFAGNRGTKWLLYRFNLADVSSTASGQHVELSLCGTPETVAQALNRGVLFN